MKKTLFAFSLLLGALSLSSQDITGLWTVDRVVVGDQPMTPVAKWFRIADNGTFEGGNGWMKNSEGTYQFDVKAMTYSAEQTNGIVDPAEPFKVEIDKEKMTWTRTEDGMPVKVILSRTEALPKAPADAIQGLWDLTRVLVEKIDVTKERDPDARAYLQIRWDRIYAMSTPDGKLAMGIWHMNGHRPHLTIIPNDKEKEEETWLVKATAKQLVLTGMSSNVKGEMRTYTRINAFPE
jgi:hypothetical protein